jgi:hypothetical protein
MLRILVVGEYCTEIFQDTFQFAIKYRLSFRHNPRALSVSSINIGIISLSRRPINMDTPNFCKTLIDIAFIN